MISLQFLIKYFFQKLNTILIQYFDYKFFYLQNDTKIPIFPLKYICSK